MGIDVRVLQHTPIRPDLKMVRTVLAGVFNLDLGVDEINDKHLIVAMAYKLLSDMGHDSDNLIYILRMLHKPLERWDPRHARSLLSLNDNSIAVLLIEGQHSAVIDYRSGKQIATAPTPVFQVSVNLSALSEFLERAMESLLQTPPEEAGSEAAAP